MILKYENKLRFYKARLKILGGRMKEMDTYITAQDAEEMRAAVARVKGIADSLLTVIDNNPKKAFYSEELDRAIWELECDAKFVVERLCLEQQSRK